MRSGTGPAIAPRLGTLRDRTRARAAAMGCDNEIALVNGGNMSTARAFGTSGWQGAPIFLNTSTGVDGTIAPLMLGFVNYTFAVSPTLRWVLACRIAIDGTPAFSDGTVLDFGWADAVNAFVVARIVRISDVTFVRIHMAETGDSADVPYPANVQGWHDIRLEYSGQTRLLVLYVDDHPIISTTPPPLNFTASPALTVYSAGGGSPAVVFKHAYGWITGP